jgi:isopenicillin N synthase-like dioxygenase
MDSWETRVFAIVGRSTGSLKHLEHYAECMYLLFTDMTQWPGENALPGFKDALLEYLSQIESLSFEFISLLAEALLLPPNAFDRFFNSPLKSDMQHRCKVVVLAHSSGVSLPG